jgi:PAS domain S-box-containing protein
VKLVGIGGLLEFVSDRGRLLLELEPDTNLVGQSWAGLWPEEMRPTVEEALAKSLGGEIVRFTGLCPTFSGVPKWWDVAVSPLRGENGEICHHLCVSRDVTQQKAIEHSLQASEQRFRALADNMAQLAWMADAHGDVFWFNKRWTEYTGTKLTDMRGKGWRSVHHPDFVENVVLNVNEAFKDRVMWEDVLPLRGLDGSYRWFLSRAVPVTDESGRVVLWCATHTDITEQRILGQRLRQLARVIELSHEAMLVWDIEDGIILWNKGCEELYGYRRNEALGAVTRELLGVVTPDGGESLEQRLLHEGEWSGEIMHRARDGSEIWVDSRQELIRAGGRNLVLETNRDITERRKADAIRNLLVAELNHRVKNTLAIVQSLAAQTARTQTDMPGFVASFTGRIQSLAAAQALLSDAHWSGALLRDLVASQFAITIGSSEKTSLDGEDVFLPPQTALQLTLILHELATNAKRYGALSSERGRVDIAWHIEPGEPRRVVIDWTERGGPAVDAPKDGGLGRQLIERIGRLPHLRSKLEFLPEGVRCRIWAELPDSELTGLWYFDPGEAPPKAGGRAPMPRQGERRAWRRILVVEDDPLDVLRIEAALADAGYLVVGSVRTAEELEHALRELALDAAVIDADATTLDTANLLNQLEARKLPIIAIGGEREREDQGERSDRIRISSPLNLSELLDGLSRLLARR